jgi:cytochrome o ubiquinol oxidase subunit 2
METHLWLQADHAGSYPGVSANFSGAGFADMRFTVNAVPTEQFTQWVARTRGAGPELSAATYFELARPSQAVAPFTYRSVDPGLFDDILNTGNASIHPASQRTER